MKREPCLVLGAGGHGRVVLDALLAEGRMQVVGVLDADGSLRGSLVCGIEILGGDELLPEFFQKGIRIVVSGLGGTSDNLPRKTLHMMAVQRGFVVQGVIHPSASVSPFAELHPSAQILSGAHVGPQAKIEEGVIINTHAVVEHDCLIGAFAHIAPGAILSGGVQVAPLAHIGSGATIRQNLRIGPGAVVGSGASVVCEVSEGTVVAGVPAKPLSSSCL